MAGKFLQFSRNLSTSKALGDLMSEPLKVSQVHQHDSAKLWKQLFLFVSCPCIAIGWVGCVLSDTPKRPEFKKYSHLRIRTKKYPWRDGVKTLFHNPHTNALPDGYETDIEGGHH